MRTFATLGLLGAAALAAASDVHDLKKDTFKPFVAENDLVLAEFFAPWCGHCKALAPEYEEAATTLKEKNIALAKIDCTEEADLCKEHGVEGYPTLKIFRGPDSVQPYSGQRKAQAIVSYMTKQALPAVSVVDKATLSEFKTADKVVLVAYFAADDKTSNETFSTVASSLRDNFLFGATNDASLATAEGVKQPAIVLYKSFDEGKSIFEEKFDTDAIAAFAKTASIPLIGEVGPETYQGYMDAGIPLAYIFAETPDERESLSESLKTVAQKHKGKVNFATIDAKAFGQHAQNLNLEVGKWPAFAIQDIQKNQKFPFSGTIDETEVGKFLDDFVEGKVEPSIKSEPIPKQDGPVTIVVAKNYDEIVLDESKDVLLELYAPWCGHCKSLAPKYDELGSLFEGFSNLVTIAKVDATANDVQDEVQGFPTIKLYKADDKKNPIEYKGSRTVEDLAKFISENGSNKVDPHAEKDEAEAEAVDTEGMPNQAPAATAAAEKATEGLKDKIVGKVSDVAEAAASVLADSDDSLDDHDEL